MLATNSADQLEIDFVSFGHAMDFQTGKLAGPSRSVLLSTSLPSSNPVINYCLPLRNLGFHHQSGALIHHQLDLDALVLFPVYSNRTGHKDYIVILRVRQVVVKFADCSKPTLRSDALIIKATEFARHHLGILSNAAKLLSDLASNTHENSSTWCEQKLQFACETQKPHELKHGHHNIFANTLVNGNQLRIARSAFTDLQDFLDTVSNALTLLPQEARKSFSCAWGVDRFCDFLDISCVTSAASSDVLFLTRTKAGLKASEKNHKSKYISPVGVNTAFGDYCRALRSDVIKNAEIKVDPSFNVSVFATSDAKETEEFSLEFLNLPILSAKQTEMILANPSILHEIIQKIEEADKAVVDMILTSAAALHFGNEEKKYLSSALLLSLMPTDDESGRFHLQHEPYSLQMAFFEGAIKKAMQDHRITEKHTHELTTSVIAIELQRFICRLGEPDGSADQGRKTNLDEAPLPHVFAEIA